MRTIRSTTIPTALAVIAISLVLAACAGSTAAPGGLDNVGGPVEQAAGGGTDSGGEQPQPPRDGVGAPIDDARIIRTGTIDLEVKDVPTALQLARDGIRAMGGYIGASNTYNEDDRPIATITYRIPVDRWEDALDLLRRLNGQTTKVVAEQTQAVEVTGAVLDLEARIKNLRASESALQEIAAKAVRVTDVLEVQNQLTQVRGEIESLSAQLKDLEDRADFATLTAGFRVPIVAVEIAAKGWDPKAVVDEAAASLVNITQALASAGIWFVIVWLPLLIVLAVVVLVAGWVLRRLGVDRPRRPRDGGWATAAAPASAAPTSDTPIDPV